MTGRGSTRRADAIVALVWVVLVGIAFRGVIGPSETLTYGDHDIVFRQRWWHVIQTLLAGELPALTRANSAGIPIEVLLNGTFTPMTLLFLIGPFDVMYDVFVASHVWIAGIGTYVLFRQMGFRPLAAFSASLVALAGPVVSFENLLVGLQGIAFAPWTYWAVFRLLTQPRPIDIGWLGIFGACHLQSIMPEILLMDVLVGVVMLIVLRPQLRSFGFLLAGIMVAFAGAAIELMPVIEALPESRRGAGFIYSEQAYYSVHYIRTSGLVLPSFWSLPETAIAHFEWLYFGNRTYLLSLYFGLLLPLALVSGRRAAIPMIVAFAMLVLAWGSQTPVHWVVSQLPLLTSARYPQKFLVLACAALTVALAWAPSALVRRRRAWPFVGYLLLIIGCWVYFTSEDFAARLPTWITMNSRRIADVSHEFLVYLIQLAQAQRLSHALVVASLGAVLLLVRAPRFRVHAIVGLAALDLAVATGYTIIARPLSARPSDALLAATNGLQTRVFRLLPNSATANTRAEVGIEFARDTATDDHRRGFWEFKNQRAAQDADADGQSNQNSAMAHVLLKKNKYPEAETLLGRLGVSKVSTWRKMDRVGIREFEIPGQPPQYVFPIEPHRAYVEAFATWSTVPQARAWGPEQQAHLMSLETWDHLIVIAPSAPEPTVTSTDAATCRETAHFDVAPPARSGNVTFDARLSCAAMVEVQETFQSRWAAFIDGLRVPVYEAEMGQTAIFVPPGEHRVELRYEPRLARWWPVSAAAWLLCLALIIGSRSAIYLAQFKPRHQ